MVADGVKRISKIEPIESSELPRPSEIRAYLKRLLATEIGRRAYAQALRIEMEALDEIQGLDPSVVPDEALVRYVHGQDAAIAAAVRGRLHTLAPSPDRELWATLFEHAPSPEAVLVHFTTFLSLAARRQQEASPSAWAEQAALYHLWRRLMGEFLRRLQARDLDWDVLTLADPLTSGEAQGRALQDITTTAARVYWDKLRARLGDSEHFHDVVPIKAAQLVKTLQSLDAQTPHQSSLDALRGAVGAKLLTTIKHGMVDEYRRQAHRECDPLLEEVDADVSNADRTMTGRMPSRLVLLKGQEEELKRRLGPYGLRILQAAARGPADARWIAREVGTTRSMVKSVLRKLRDCAELLDL
jgi:hypothetical protein